MSGNRFDRLRADHTGDMYLGEAPDLGPLRSWLRLPLSGWRAPLGISRGGVSARLM